MMALLPVIVGVVFAITWSSILVLISELATCGRCGLSLHFRRRTP